ncbi:hypothetical protein PHMEG_0009324, partial [Phytophthora megakarya]
EDKLRVQIAAQFEGEGLQVTCIHAARQIHGARASKDLHLRMESLKRTYRKVIRDFPRCFFGDQHTRRRIGRVNHPGRYLGWPWCSATRSSYSFYKTWFRATVTSAVQGQ